MCDYSSVDEAEKDDCQRCWHWGKYEVSGLIVERECLPVEEAVDGGRKMGSQLRGVG